MRAKLVNLDLIECVIGLGPNLFYNSPMEACIVICRMQKASERHGRILFINAVNEVTRERAQSFLEEAHIQRIVAAYRAFADEDGFAHVASLDEIRANNANLNIPLYVRPAVSSRENGADGTQQSLAETLAEWQASSHSLRASMDSLFTTLRDAGLLATPAPKTDDPM